MSIAGMTFADWEVALFVVGCIALAVVVIYGEFFDTVHTFRRKK